MYECAYTSVMNHLFSVIIHAFHSFIYQSMISFSLESSRRHSSSQSARVPPSFARSPVRSFDVGVGGAGEPSRSVGHD